MSRRNQHISYPSRTELKLPLCRHHDRSRMLSRIAHDWNDDERQPLLRHPRILDDAVERRYQVFGSEIGQYRAHYQCTQRNGCVQPNVRDIVACVRPRICEGAGEDGRALIGHVEVRWRGLEASAVVEPEDVLMSVELESNLWGVRIS